MDPAHAQLGNRFETNPKRLQKAGRLRGGSDAIPERLQDGSDTASKRLCPHTRQGRAHSSEKSGFPKRVSPKKLLFFGERNNLRSPQRVSN